jgi:hypothetical protein
VGESPDIRVLCKMSPRIRSIAIAASLSIMVLSAMVFSLATHGFYGTVAPSLWTALHPTTLQQSDDVFRCSTMNGQGSDDEVFVMLLVLLFPLVLWRLIRLQTPPSWIELCVFGMLSLPFFVGMFAGPATCADITLTLFVGHNPALGVCLVSWFSAAILYFGIGQSR